MIASKVVLSLVAETATSVFKSSLISANKTILAFVGTEFAVNVSDINVVVGLEKVC